MRSSWHKVTHCPLSLSPRPSSQIVSPSFRLHAFLHAFSLRVSFRSRPSSPSRRHAHTHSFPLTEHASPAASPGNRRTAVHRRLAGGTARNVSANIRASFAPLPPKRCAPAGPRRLRFAVPALLRGRTHALASPACRPIALSDSCIVPERCGQASALSDLRPVTTPDHAPRNFGSSPDHAPPSSSVHVAPAAYICPTRPNSTGFATESVRRPMPMT